MNRLIVTLLINFTHFAFFGFLGSISIISSLLKLKSSPRSGGTRGVRWWAGLMWDPYASELIYKEENIDKQKEIVMGKHCKSLNCRFSHDFHDKKRHLLFLKCCVWNHLSLGVCVLSCHSYILSRLPFECMLGSLIKNFLY